MYSVITYYLRHKPEVDAYLKEREALAASVREEAERRFPSAGIRERFERYLKSGSGRAFAKRHFEP